jgi:hypothetical protein
MTFAKRLSISSLEPVSGKLPDAWLDGRTEDLFGPPPVPASPSRSPAGEPEQMTRGICGLTYFASPVPSGPLASWENRLRERLAMIGSAECALIWKAKAMPSGRLKSRLVPATRHTNGPATGGSLWTTVSATDAAGRSNRYAQGGNPLTMQMTQAWWATPMAREWRSDHGKLYGTKGGSIARQMLEASGWKPPGSGAPTGKHGAPNPIFACWLMGWPEELTSGVLQAIALFRKSRRKSSKA